MSSLAVHPQANPQADEQAAHQLSQSISRRMSAKIQDAQKLLADAKKVAVVCHINPDADAIGAATAMVMALYQRGIEAVFTYGEDELPAKSLLSIPGWERFVNYTELPEDIDTWISVDCASPDRLGALKETMLASDRLLVVDHHDSNPYYGTVNLIDEESESSTMVLLDFFGVWGIKLTQPMAHALYAGLMMDTVSFQFGRSRMHTAAARLLDKGLDPSKIGADLLDAHPFSYLPFLGTVLSTAELDDKWGDGAGLVHTTVNYDNCEKVGFDEINAVIDLVRATNAGDVAAVFKETVPNEWTVSLRSKAKVDVSEVANAFGGGGHVHAAGFTFNGTRAELLEAISQRPVTFIDEV